MSEKATPQWLHNWLYSVVPISERVEDWNQGNFNVNYPLRAYLTGYCRNCGRAFSQVIPSTNYGYTETQMSVAKFGCVGPEGA